MNIRRIDRALSWASIGALATLSLTACTSLPMHRAPVEDRHVSEAPPSAPVKPPPGAENAGKPGYYTVKAGDNLYHISLESGQSWHDIAAWNGLDNPNLIEVGQVLRVVPPESGANVIVKPVTTAKIESRSSDARGPASKPAATPAASGASGASVASAPVVASAASGGSAPVASEVPARASDEPVWSWPVSGAIVMPFAEGKNKGVNLSGKAGDPVYAAAAGRVVYAGSGLRGYGNLVIIKHEGDYLSAYAYNQTLLVKDDQVVSRGQKIAEMGSSDTDRVQLHFEIRKAGKPIDPAQVLPAH